MNPVNYTLRIRYSNIKYCGRPYVRVTPNSCLSIIFFHLTFILLNLPNFHISNKSQIILPWENVWRNYYIVDVIYTNHSSFCAVVTIVVDVVVWDKLVGSINCFIFKNSLGAKCVGVRWPSAISVVVVVVV